MKRPQIKMCFKMSFKNVNEINTCFICISFVISNYGGNGNGELDTGSVWSSSSSASGEAVRRELTSAALLVNMRGKTETQLLRKWKSPPM